eukprot:614865-Rhodomonas_salina.2
MKNSDRQAEVDARASDAAGQARWPFPASEDSGLSTVRFFACRVRVVLPVCIARRSKPACVPPPPPQRCARPCRHAQLQHNTREVRRGLQWSMQEALLARGGELVPC